MKLMMTLLVVLSGLGLPPAPAELAIPLAEYRASLEVVEVAASPATGPIPYGAIPTGPSDIVLPPVLAGPERWRGLVEGYFPTKWVPWAMDIMECESEGDPDAKNPRSTAAGLFQFLRSTWDWVNDATGAPSYDAGGPYDPEWNVLQAAWLLEHGNSKPWTGYTHWECKANSLIP